MPANFIYPDSMKKSTPKKQQAHSQTSRRYKSFRNFARVRLSESTSLAPCPKCKEPKPLHIACPTCGTYNGRQVINMKKKIDKITKVKA